jgi:hypothetical protein
MHEIAWQALDRYDLMATFGSLGVAVHVLNHMLEWGRRISVRIG